MSAKVRHEKWYTALSNIHDVCATLPARAYSAGSRCDTGLAPLTIGKKTKIFDPVDRFAPLTDPLVVTDAKVAKRWSLVDVSGRQGYWKRGNAAF